MTTPRCSFSRVLDCFRKTRRSVGQYYPLDSKDYILPSDILSKSKVTTPTTPENVVRRAWNSWATLTWLQNINGIEDVVSHIAATMTLNYFLQKFVYRTPVAEAAQTTREDFQFSNLNDLENTQDTLVLEPVTLRARM
jgi:hypothetical protein